jgi:hypothetical protein
MEKVLGQNDDFAEDLEALDADKENYKLSVKWEEKCPA